MQSGRCPKCSSARIATTRYTQYLGVGLSGPTFQLYACAECRYTEQYMVDSVESRVSVLDTWSWVKPKEGPFR